MTANKVKESSILAALFYEKGIVKTA